MSLDKKANLAKKRDSQKNQRLSLNRSDLPVSAFPFHFFAKNAKEINEKKREVWAFTAVFVYYKINPKDGKPYRFEKTLYLGFNAVKTKGRNIYEQFANLTAYSPDQALAKLNSLIRKARMMKLSEKRYPFKNFKLEKKAVDEDFVRNAGRERIKTLRDADIFGDG